MKLFLMLGLVGLLMISSVLAVNNSSGFAPNVCPSTTTMTANLFAVIAIALILFIIGLWQKNMFLILIAGVLMILCSLPLYGCDTTIGFIMTGIGIVCIPMALYKGKW